MINRLISLLLILVFGVSDVSVYAQSALTLPLPGMRVSLSPAAQPPLLKGIKVYPNEPLRFDFILDRGVGATLVPALDKGRPQGSPLHDESNRLIKYFLAALTIPEKDVWVNLSPYEKDRIVPEAFGQTEMGRDLLAQDYILKQVTASLMYPEGDVGKKFWSKVYAAMQDKYGTTDIPVDTFNKVWIVPEKAEVFEKNNAAYVVGSRLKVMLDSDYTAIVGALRATPLHAASLENTADIKSIIRETIIPILEQEVNEGENFAQLRQVYHSLILATWYKRKIVRAIHESPLQGYIDHNKTVGVDIVDKNENEKIWSQYVEAFKKGVFNYIKDDVRARHGVPEMASPRQYFSGGMSLSVPLGYVGPERLPVMSDGAMVVQASFNILDELEALDAQHKNGREVLVAEELDLLSEIGLLDPRQAVTEDMILQIHRFVITHEFDRWHQKRPDGSWSNERVVAGAYREKDLKYPISPRWQDVSEKMTYLVYWLNRHEADLKAGAIEEMVAEFYIRFIDIHPFLDGNGRTGRLLLNALLKRYGREPVDFSLIGLKAWVIGYALMLPSDARHFADRLRKAQQGESTKTMPRYGTKKMSDLKNSFPADTVIEGDDFLNWVRSRLGYWSPPEDLFDRYFRKVRFLSWQQRELNRIFMAGMYKSRSLSDREAYAKLLKKYGVKVRVSHASPGNDFAQADQRSDDVARSAQKPSLQQLAVIKMQTIQPADEILSVVRQYANGHDFRNDFFMSANGLAPLTGMIENPPYVNDVQKIFSVHSKQRLTVPENLNGADIAIVGPSKNANEVLAFIKTFPGIRSIHIIEAREWVFPQIDVQLQAYQKSGGYLPPIYGHCVNVLSMPKELGGQIDLIFSSNVIDDFPDGMIVQAFQEMERVVKVGGAVVVNKFGFRKWFEVEDFPGLEFHHVKDGIDDMWLGVKVSDKAMALGGSNYNPSKIDMAGKNSDAAASIIDQKEYEQIRQDVEKQILWRQSFDRSRGIAWLDFIEEALEGRLFLMNLNWFFNDVDRVFPGLKDDTRRARDEILAGFWAKAQQMKGNQLLPQMPDDWPVLREEIQQALGWDYKCILPSWYVKKFNLTFNAMNKELRRYIEAMVLVRRYVNSDEKTYAQALIYFKDDPDILERYFPGFQSLGQRVMSDVAYVFDWDEMLTPEIQDGVVVLRGRNWFSEEDRGKFSAIRDILEKHIYSLEADQKKALQEDFWAKISQMGGLFAMVDKIVLEKLSQTSSGFYRKTHWSLKDVIAISDKYDEQGTTTTLKAEFAHFLLEKFLEKSLEMNSMGFYGIDLSVHEMFDAVSQSVGKSYKGVVFKFDDFMRLFENLTFTHVSSYLMSSTGQIRGMVQDNSINKVLYLEETFQKHPVLTAMSLPDLVEDMLYAVTKSKDRVKEILAQDDQFVSHRVGSVLAVRAIRLMDHDPRRVAILMGMMVKEGEAKWFSDYRIFWKQFVAWSQDPVRMAALDRRMLEKYALMPVDQNSGVLDSAMKGGVDVNPSRIDGVLEGGGVKPGYIDELTPDMSKAPLPLVELGRLFQEMMNDPLVRKKLLENRNLDYLPYLAPALSARFNELGDAARLLGARLVLHNTQRAYVNNILKEGVKPKGGGIVLVVYDLSRTRSLQLGFGSLASELVTDSNFFGNVSWHNIWGVVCDGQTKMIEDNEHVVRADIELKGYSWLYSPAHAVSAISAIDLSFDINALQDFVMTFLKEHESWVDAYRQEARQRLMQAAVVYLMIGRLTEGVRVLGAKNDSAQSGDIKGGIDLNPSSIDMAVKSAGEGIQFKVDPAMFERMKNASGITPVIIGIHPVGSFQKFFEISLPVT
ncbi:MAG: Fic family protein [Candidatus Omnitrophota bacterium]